MEDDEYLSSLNTTSIYRNDLKIVESYKTQVFDPKSLLDRDGLMCIIAMTGSGKTVLIKDLLSHIYKEYKSVLMFSRTAKLQKCYDFIDRSCIYDTFDENVLTELWDHHKALQLAGKKLDRTLIIMDDLICDKNFKKSSILDDYCVGGRHLGFNLWILSQNFTSLKPLMRNNASWSVAFDLDSANERKHFVGQYLSAKNNRVGDLLFRKIVKEAPYQCIVIENHKVGASTDEKVRKFIANPSPKSYKIKGQIKGVSPISISTMTINSRPRR